MPVRLMLITVLTAVASATPLPCVPGASLASYEALGSMGCLVDAAIPLVVNNFSYSVITSSSPGVVTPDTAISVTPIFPGFERFGINFTSNTFTLGAGDFVQYSIGFTWDPPDMRSADDLMETSTPVAPGFAKDTTTLCLGAAFVGTTCSTSTATLMVSHDGITPMVTDSTTFSSVAILGVLNTLELNGGPGGMGGSSEIRGFENNITNNPEPAAWSLAVAGLLIVAGLRRAARR